MNNLAFLLSLAVVLAFAARACGQETDTFIVVDTAHAIHNVQNPQDRGDANASGEIDIDDITTLIWYIFQGGPHPGRFDKIVELWICVDTVIVSGSDTLDLWRSGPDYRGLFIE